MAAVELLGNQLSKRREALRVHRLIEAIQRSAQTGALAQVESET